MSVCLLQFFCRLFCDTEVVFYVLLENWDICALPAGIDPPAHARRLIFVFVFPCVVYRTAEHKEEAQSGLTLFSVSKCCDLDRIYRVDSKSTRCQLKLRPIEVRSLAAFSRSSSSLLVSELSSALGYKIYRR